MTVKFDGMTFPAQAKIGDRVDVTITIENTDPYGLFLRCGVSVLDDRGLPIMVWDDINYPELSYEYASPVISAFMMPDQPSTFHGHYFQNEEIIYPANVRLYSRDPNAGQGSPWDVEPTIYQFTVAYQPRYYELSSVVVAGSGHAYLETNLYIAGSYATLNAVPDTNFTFDHWRVIMNGVQTVYNQNPLTIQMNGNAVAECYFREVWVPPTYYYLNVSLGAGFGSWSGAQASYDPGDTATLTAQPGDGYEFVRWEVSTGSGAPQVFTTPSISIVMNSDKSAVVYFKTRPVYTLAVSVAQGTGTFTGGKTTYNPGETASLSAQPGTGFKFWKWVVSGQTFTTASISFVMNANKTAQVYFIPEGTTPPPDGGGIGGSIGIVILAALVALGLSKKKK